MLKPARSHSEYVAFVKRELLTKQVPIPARHQHVQAKLRLLDLSLAIPLLAPLYAAGGRPAVPPVDLFRALLAMLLCGETSIDDWVLMMRDHAWFSLPAGHSSQPADPLWLVHTPPVRLTPPPMLSFCPPAPPFQPRVSERTHIR